MKYQRQILKLLYKSPNENVICKYCTHNKRNLIYKFSQFQILLQFVSQEKYSNQMNIHMFTISNYIFILNSYDESVFYKK